MVQLLAGLKVPRSPSSPAGILNSRVPSRPGCGESKMVGMTKLTSIPLTGVQFRISAGDYSATVTELGAGLREFRHRDLPVIAEYGPDEPPPGAAGQLLAPWPNRVDRGRYTIGGTSYQLDVTEPAHDNAIHGLTRWANWQEAGLSADAVRLRHMLLAHPGYPFCLELTAEYRLSASDGLQVSVTAANQGSRPAPYGTGQHPYLTTGAATVDECELLLPATRWLQADERGIPQGEPQDVTGTPYDFREPRLVGGTRIDHAFTGLTAGPDGRARAELSGAGVRVAFWAGQGYRWLQAFTGDTLDSGHRRRALAVEPMTCPPNSFVTGTDLLILQPGDSITHEWGITVRRS
jgi:aldose 1-epimerase